MAFRSVMAAAGTAALVVLATASGIGAAAAQSSYANPYGYAYPQQPYGGYPQAAVAPAYPQQGYPQQAYPQAYGYPQQGNPYAPQGHTAYGPAAYVQPHYGSPYAPQAGDPFPEYPAQPAYQDAPTVVVSGATQPVPAVTARQAVRSEPVAAPPRLPAPPAAERLPPAAATEPVEVPAPATADRPQAPEGTFDQLYAARYGEPQVAGFQPDPHEGYGGWLSELRLGVLEHDAGLWSGKKEDGLDINGEVLFVSPDFLDIIFSPRPTIGGSLHTEGETNVVYFGLTWQWNILPWLYLEGHWGPAFHDGNLTGQDADTKGYGCAVLSRGAAALGVRYEHHSVQAFYSHMSNGDLCDENDGIDAAGVRYGYRF